MTYHPNDDSEEARRWRLNRDERFRRMNASPQALYEWDKSGDKGEQALSVEDTDSESGAYMRRVREDSERRARIEETREDETTVDSSPIHDFHAPQRDDYDAQIPGTKSYTSAHYRPEEFAEPEGEEARPMGGYRVVPDVKVFVPDENREEVKPTEYFYAGLISGNREGSTYQQLLTLRYSENEIASDEMKVQVYSKLKGMSDRRYLLLRELQPGEAMPWQESWTETPIAE